MALGAFGPERLVCGSDWPVALLNGDYVRVWRETVRVIEHLDPLHAEQLLSGNALRLYGLGVGSRRRERRRDRAHRSGDRQDQGPDHVRRVHGRLQAAERAGSLAAARPLPQLAARGRARADADRRARAARRRRHVRHEPRARIAPHGHGVRQRPADRHDPAGAAPGAPDPRARGDRDGGHEARRRRSPAALERCLAAMDAAETTQAFIAADRSSTGSSSRPPATRRSPR